MGHLGNTLDSIQADSCYPYITNAQMKVTTSWNGTALDPQAIASPCGSIGTSLLIKRIPSLMTLTNYHLGLRSYQ